MPERYKLGSIACPSGILVALDVGYLWLWSGTSTPQPHFSGSEDAETRAAIQSMRDYRIVGPDAVRTADIANMVAINSSRFIYDLPEPGRDALLAKINQGASTNGLDAHVEQEPTRVPHRVRAQRAADLGGGDFFMEGPMVVALGGIPNRPLPVTAERLDFGGNVGSRWGEVTVTVSTGRPERSQLVGYFGVDYGTALVGDADALSDRRVEVELRQQIERGGRFAVGTCRVGGATVLGMDNSWGDGIFPVYADRDASGQLVSVRLVLGDEGRRQLAEKVWERAQREGS